jgi:2-keto-4-pentenoate hydratase/2-oxohepta-3-ene-1,7-dioic acid hydratase in catechol pathway
MIFPVREIIAFLSRIMTLEPGDIIATGTPAGVAAAHDPPRYLKSGDVVEVDIENLGVLRNLIADAY